MDENQLKKTLQNMDVPAADENAKKRALNLAMAEFDTAQKESKKISPKIFQGSSFLSRLIHGSNKNRRRETMLGNRKMIYGGMATAMAVVLVCGISVQQFNTGSYKEQTLPSRVIGRGDASTEQPAQTEIAQGYKQAVQEENVQGTEHAITPPAATREDPLADWNEQRGDKSQSAFTETTTEAEKEQWRLAQVERTRQATQTKDELANKPARQKYAAEGEADLSAASPRSLFAQSAPPPAEEKRAAGGAIYYPVAPADNAAVYSYHDVGRDNFKDFEENQAKAVGAEPVSTFSLDVDTASYSFVRNHLNAGALPQKDAVRVEEMINYFDYDYPLPEAKTEPFKATVAVLPSPWKDGNKLIHIGVRGYDIVPAEKPHSNLVFLIDTSGSMDGPNRLPLAVQSFKMLLETLQPDDTIGIVVYAGAAGTVLEPTKVSDKAKIIKALDNLSAGGSTAGGEGIRQAYQLAEANFNKEAVNRVILASDGDFNVGIIDPEELKGFVERKRETGIYLSILGFGQGNYNDLMMQELAQNGNGTAAYIDTLNEARKVLVQEAGSTLFTIAKDVKVQVEFNPVTVAEYRLVGYETRHLNQEDFNNDAVDAGDIGSGHTVTAIYEITPVGGPVSVDPSRYTKPELVQSETGTQHGDEYAFLKIRYKLPDEDTSKLITTPIAAGQDRNVSDDVKFATAVATFGQMLKGGKNTGKMTYDDVITMAQESKGKDEYGYRAEFINLVRLAKSGATMEDTQP